MDLRALETSILRLEKSWKNPGNLVLKKGTNPVVSLLEILQFLAVTSL